MSSPDLSPHRVAVWAGIRGTTSPNTLPSLQVLPFYWAFLETAGPGREKASTTEEGGWSSPGGIRGGHGPLVH